MRAKDLPQNPVQRAKMEVCMMCDFREVGACRCVMMDCNIKAPWKKKRCPFKYWKKIGDVKQ